ncbi:MAG: lamin tail domain-containing protein [Candidatus Pacearchaeota archaeon]|nr:lamin tail domain-containing protein [Candidatus Pacearchaeota archaeon]
MKKGLVLFLFVFLINFVSASVFINEVMPNPDDECNDCTEWIELYAEKETNLSGFFLDTNGSNQRMELNITIKGYLIFTKNKTKFLEFWNIDENKIIEFKNMGLANTGDTIYLYNGTLIVDTTTYPSFSSDANFTWEKCGGWIKNKFPTPGAANNCSSQNQTNETREEKIFVFFPREVYNNKTEFEIIINLLNFSPGLYDVKIDIKANESYLNRVWYNNTWSPKNRWLEGFVFVNNENFSFVAKNIIESEFFGEATLQVKLNNTKVYTSEIYNITILDASETENKTPEESEDKENKVGKLNMKYPQKVTCNKNFTISLEVFDFSSGSYDVKIDIFDESEKRIGKIWNGSKWVSTYSYALNSLHVVNGTGFVSLVFKIENYEGEAILRPRIRRTNKNSYEEFEEKLLFVECPEKGESKIKIKKAPEKGRFGLPLRINLEINRGDTRRRVVYVYVRSKDGKRVSEKITLQIEKFSSFEDEIEIELKCLQEAGYYEIVAEGLGEKEEKEIYLEACTEEPTKKETSEKSFSFEPEQKNIAPPITGHVVEDKQTRAIKFFPYIFASLCLLFAIYVMIKNQEKNERKQKRMASR